MSVTIITYARLGPFGSGSTLTDVPVPYAQRLIQRYGMNLSIRGRYPGTYLYQDGATIFVYPSGGGPGPSPWPQPDPNPSPWPRPNGNNNIRVMFRSTIYNQGTAFQEGNVYSFTMARLTQLLRSGSVSLTNTQGQPIDMMDLPSYQGDLIYADQVIYAMRGNRS